MYTVYIYNCIYTLTSNWYLFHFWVQLVPHRALRWPVMRDARRLAQWMVYDGTCPKKWNTLIYDHLWKPMETSIWHMLVHGRNLDVSMDANG